MDSVVAGVQHLFVFRAVEPGYSSLLLLGAAGAVGALEAVRNPAVLVFGARPAAPWEWHTTAIGGRGGVVSCDSRSPKSSSA